MLSLILGLVQFNVSGVKDASTSLNEVPLLISLLYLKNPLYLIISVIITSFSSPDQSAIIPTMIFHVGSLIPIYYLTRRIFELKPGALKLALLSVSSVIIYYFLLIGPLMTITYKLFGLTQMPFLQFYTELTKGIYFEILVSSICVMFFHLQFRSTKLLNEHLDQLETTISERTKELDATVRKLLLANQELQTINDTLDQMVLDRTQELENKNTQLTGYAFINSHLLRAPLANIIGLSDAIKHEIHGIENQELLEKFQYSCYELDQIIRLLGEFLSKESVYSPHQLSTLQNKIIQIAKEIREMV